MLPLQVGNDADWKSITASRGIFQLGQDSFRRFAHCLALKEDGTLWAWGNSQHGQLGLATYVTNTSYGINQPTQVGTNTDWRHVPTDDNHFYREGADSAWPWKSVASGWRHFVGIRHDGTLWASGDNFVGQIGRRPIGVLFPSPANSGDRPCHCRNKPCAGFQHDSQGGAASRRPRRLYRSATVRIKNRCGSPHWPAGGVSVTSKVSPTRWMVCEVASGRNGSPNCAADVAPKANCPA